MARYESNYSQHSIEVLDTDTDWLTGQKNESVLHLKDCTMNEYLIG